MSRRNKVVDLGEHYEKKGRAKERDTILAWLLILQKQIIDEKTTADLAPGLDHGDTMTSAEKRGALGIVGVLIDKIGERHAVEVLL